MTSAAHLPTREVFDELEAVCRRHHKDSEGLYSGPRTFQSAKLGNWAYASTRGGLFVAVRADNSPFPLTNENISRSIQIKSDAVVVAPVARLRAWLPALGDIKVTRDCSTCGGYGKVDRYTLEKRARHEVLSRESDFYGSDEARHRLERGEFDRDIRDLVDEDAGGHDVPDGAPCPKCRGRQTITRTHRLARVHLTIFHPSSLAEALAFRFIGDRDMATIYARGSRRPDSKDLRRPIHITSKNWIVSFNPSGYNTRTYDFEHYLPAPLERTPELMRYLLESEPVDDLPEQRWTPDEQRIRSYFHFEAGGEKRPSLREARNHIEDRCRRLAPSVETISLRLCYVEAGVEFSRSFGDVDLAFYNSLESMYNKALGDIASCNLLGDFELRCRRIFARARYLGWGLYEGLCVIFETHSNRISDPELPDNYAEIDRLTARLQWKRPDPSNLLPATPAPEEPAHAETDGTQLNLFAQ